jgi:glycosyltransferase involved in cell wall biosynthesis
MPDPSQAPALAAPKPANAGRVGLVIPALDEELALPRVLAELPSGWIDRVVVVDNGSRDRTAEVARAAGAEVVHEPRRGYGRACQRGLAELFSGPRALAPDDWVAFLDGDHSDYPEDLTALLMALIEGRADFVLGSRLANRESARAMLPQSRWGTRFACLLMRLFFGVRASDLGPMRALSRRNLERLEVRDPNFGWTIEMQLKAHAAGLRTLEIPVRYRERIGVSKISGTLSGTLRAGYKILGWIFVFRLRGDRRAAVSGDASVESREGS